MIVRFTEAYKWRLPERIEGASELSCTEKRVLLRLGRYEGTRGDARPKLETLAESLGISRSSAQRAVVALERQGLITVTRRNHGRLPSVVVFLDHPWLHEGPTTEPIEIPPEAQADPPPRAPKPSRPAKPKRAKPAQPELPGVPVPPPPPPREKSRELLLYDYFEAKRRGHLGRLGVDYVPESKPVSPAWATMVFSAALAMLDGDPERVSALVDLYFDEEWPAKYEVPYCFGAFAKVWRDQLLPNVPVAA